MSKKGGDNNKIKLCPTHPTYKGKRQPRVNCPTCWKIYQQQHNLSDKEVQELYQAFLEKNKKKAVMESVIQKKNKKATVNKIDDNIEKKIKKEIMAILLGESTSSFREIRRKYGVGGSVIERIKNEVQEEMVKKDIVEDVKERRAKNIQKLYEKKYKKALEMVDDMNELISNILELEDYVPEVFHIAPMDVHHSKRAYHATAIAVISDVHIEERVDPETISAQNEYNVSIALLRLNEYFRKVLHIINMHRATMQIDNLILANLGDNMSGYIHTELVEDNYLSPTEAMMLTMDWMVSGINFLKKQGKFKNIDVIMIPGNHGRTTDRKRIATSYKNNYEWILGHFLRKHYKNDKVVNVIVPKTELFYYKVYNKYVIRFLHGDLIKYWGGVGGLTIPANKAIAQWDKSIKADLTIFGHYHTLFDGGNFLVNGSVIGYNAFAQAKKFSFEYPRQLLTLIDGLGRKITTHAIYLNEYGSNTLNIIDYNEELFSHVLASEITNNKTVKT